LCYLSAIQSDPDNSYLAENQILRAENERLRAESAFLRRSLLETQERMEKLELALARALRNSGNSSKPPSSDITKDKGPQPDPGSAPAVKRKIGGQPGHPGHERKAFPPEQVDEVIPHAAPRVCPTHGTALEERPALPPRVVQQIVLPVKLFLVRERQARGAWCGRCQKIHYAPLPPAVEAGGLADARFTALCGYLKGKLSLSYTEMRALYGDVFGLELSTGYLAKLCQKTSQAAQDPYEEMKAELPRQERLHIDETGHREQGKKWWTWAFRASAFCCFVIERNRSGAVLRELLGEEFAGVIHADYYGVYRQYGKEFLVLIQYCLAHLIRDIRFLAECGDPIVRDYGEEMLERVRRLFHLWHEQNRNPSPGLAGALREAQRDMQDLATSPPEGEAAHALIENMARRFRENGDAYFVFLSVPGVDPTNNLAEQILRFIAMARGKTQGTRGARGRGFCERLWSLKATCQMQGKSLFEFLTRSVEAYWSGTPAPSLLPERAAV
jgi:transposase